MTNDESQIFISRKDGRLYVRQALRPVFDVPVTITDVDRPIGTHVYMALPPAAGEKALRWTALSMPVEIPPPAKTARGKRGRDVEEAVLTAIPVESATSAFDRIQLSGEVLDQLSQYIWAGGSIIVSDHGITHETGTGTDFIVETKHE